MYTVMIATLIGALFISSVFMNIDSTSAISVTAGSMLIDYPMETRWQALVVRTLLVGGCMLLAGMLKLGFLTRFVSTR
jgi:sulfate permease, SulP family